MNLIYFTDINFLSLKKIKLDVYQVILYNKVISLLLLRSVSKYLKLVNCLETMWTQR